MNALRTLLLVGVACGAANKAVGRNQGEVVLLMDPHPACEPMVALVADGLIERVEVDGDWRLTEKGRVMVDAIMSVPLPVQAWRMPISGPFGEAAAGSIFHEQNHGGRV